MGRKERYSGETIYGGNSLVTYDNIASVASSRGYEPVSTSEFTGGNINDSANIGKKFIVAQESTPWAYNHANPTASGGQSVKLTEMTYEGDGKFRPTGEGSAITISPDTQSNTFIFKRKRK